MNNLQEDIALYIMQHEDCVADYELWEIATE